MQQYNNLLLDKPISGESFSDELHSDAIPLDKTYLPLDQSVIWHCNYLFWKHFSLWEQTYGEHYEASLPSGISESHKDEFIEKSARKFLHLLLTLEKKKKLPKKIIVLEQGPGTGIYAKKFLDFFKTYDTTHHKNFYTRLLYLLQDTSREILALAEETLQEHKTHTQSFINIPQNLKHQILFVRHSNVWDQFPARLLVISPCHPYPTFRHSREGENLYKKIPTVSEILVQAVIDKTFFNTAAPSPHPDPLLQERERKEEFSSPCRERIKVRGKTGAIEGYSIFPRGMFSFQKNNLESFVTTHPHLWKPLMRSIKFKTKQKKLTQKQISDLPHSDVVKHLAKIAVDTQEIVISNAVLDNLQTLINVIDWQRNGYAEIVDIIVPTMDGFYKDRRPRKYDGSIATVVNGPLIKAFLQKKNKHARFDKIRGINYTVTMRNNTLQTLIDAKEFITIGEIAARRDEPIENLKQNAEALFTLGIDVVGFSDQAFVKPEYLFQREIIQTGIFQQLPGQALMPILKTRNKTWDQIKTLTDKLKEQGVGNLFVVTGDPGLEKELLNDSVAVTQKLKDDFFVGGVANPDTATLPKMKEKIKAGTNFFIMQATYDKRKFDDWVKAIKREKLHEQTPIIAAIVPIVSKRTLSVLQFINDMSVADKVIKQFENLENEVLREKGIALAKQMVEEYKQTGIFSGIYIYSKSHEVICEVMGFPYHATKKQQDTL